MKKTLKKIELNFRLLMPIYVLALVMSACEQRPQQQEIFRPEGSSVTNGATVETRSGSQNNNLNTGENTNNSGLSNNNGSLANVPQHMQEYEYCRRLLGGPVDYSHPDGQRCYQIIYQNCRGCRVDEDLRPIDTFSAYGYSGRIAWPAHEDWWPELTGYLDPTRSHIAFQSPYFNAQNFPSGHAGASGQYPQHPGGANPFVYCHNKPADQPCRLDATQVWSVSNIDKSYQYNLAPGKNNKYIYTIVQPLDQPCTNQHQIQQSNCNPQFRANFGNFLGSLKQSGANFKASGKATLDGLGASLANMVPNFSVGSIFPNVNVNAGGNYTVSNGGTYVMGASRPTYTTSSAGNVVVGGAPNYSIGSQSHIGTYAGQPMAAYGHYLNYGQTYNNYNLGGSEPCVAGSSHPGSPWGCQNINPCYYNNNC
ncbi:MAG TPA: hypothetical protein PKC21_01030 [Oligoflexia bacterium]|nr:hypothetical protein [Oligoflexia bacterium]HMR23912.1 hypothetical protein [Oligoflexia bacterium]